VIASPLPGPRSAVLVSPPRCDQAFRYASWRHPAICCLDIAARRARSGECAWSVCPHECRYAESWAGYIALERGLRNLREARTLYKRCHSRRFLEGGQTQLCEAWLRFEQEEGRWLSFFFFVGGVQSCARPFNGR
jgi:hypothetical protein